DHSLNGCGLKQIGVVLNVAFQFLACFGKNQRYFKLSSSGVYFKRQQLCLPEMQSGPGLIQQTEQHLEERRSGQVALWKQHFHQLLKRDILMSMGLKGQIPGPLQESNGSRMPREIAP